MPKIFHSNLLLTSASALILSVTVVMGGCSKKDKGGAPVISAEKAPLGLSGLSNQDFAKHFAVPKRDIDGAQSDKALAALGLSESGQNGLTWDSQSGGNGSYVFKNMSSKSDDGTMAIGQAKIFGVRMDGDTATFDRADFSGLKLTAEDVVLNVEAMSLARPTADTAKAIVQSLENLTEDIDLDFDDNAKFGFGALSMKGLNVQADEVSGTIDQLAWGVDKETSLADLKLEALDFTMPQKGSDVRSLLTLKSVSAKNFNTDQIKDGFAAGASGGAPKFSTLMSSFNAYKKPYDSASIEGLAFDSNAISVDMPKMEAEAKTKGDVTTINQVTEAINITMKKDGPREFRQMYDTLQQLGFDAITFKGSQTTVLDKGKDTMEVKDGIFDMKDGFRLNYTYGASGLSALAQSGEASHSDQAAQLQNMLENMKINGMTLSLEDKSIVERGLKLAAQMRGGEVKQVKREMRAAVTFAPLAARNDLEKDIASQLGSSFMDFIDEGGTLTVKLAPNTPINLSKIQDIQNLTSDDLGFSARHDK